MHRKRVARNSRLHRGIHLRLVVRAAGDERERGLMEPVAPQMMCRKFRSQMQLAGLKPLPPKNRFHTATADHCHQTPSHHSSEAPIHNPSFFIASIQYYNPTRGSILRDRS